MTEHNQQMEAETLELLSRAAITMALVEIFSPGINPQSMLTDVQPPKAVKRKSSRLSRRVSYPYLNLT